MTYLPSKGDFLWAPSGAAFEDKLERRAVAQLLHLMADLACLRNDSRRWRLEALEAMNRMLGAAASASVVVKLRTKAPPVVASVFDSGFKRASQHEAFLAEFNQSPFQDPLSRRVLEAARGSDLRTMTVARRDAVDDGEWYTSPTVERYRREAWVDDCIMSVHRSVCAGGGAMHEGPQMMVLLVFRAWGDAAAFSVRDRLLLDLLHQGLEWLYRAEATLERVTRGTALSPRLRETLDLLLAEETERQVAARMGLSIHTVHDYVKALYAHFGVSSRGELMARWIQSGETVPKRRIAHGGN